MWVCCYQITLFFIKFLIWIVICKMCCVRSLSGIQLFVTLWAVSCHAPLSMRFSQQEHWSGMLFSPPGDLHPPTPPPPGVKPNSFMSPELAGRCFTGWEGLLWIIICQIKPDFQVRVQCLNTLRTLWFFISSFFNLFLNWRIIALQNLVVFCHTSTWISHGCTYVPSLLNALFPPISHTIPPL